MVFLLSAKSRNTKGEKMRGTDELPAVVYGAKGETQSLTLNSAEFAKLFKEAGESSLVDLTIDGKETGKVLVHDMQFDPVSDKVVHVDLKRVDMNKPITARVQLRFVGEAPVIKEHGGTLMRTVSEVEVSCLPKDLLSHIDVDLSTVVNFESIIKIADLKLSPGVTIIKPSADTLVAKPKRALTEEEIKVMEAAAAPADLSKIEVAKEKKAEEGEEGAEAEAEKEKEPAKKEEKKEEKK